jgi:hypothetical protein
LQECGAFDSALSEITDDDDDAGRATAFAALKETHACASKGDTSPGTKLRGVTP